MRETERKFDAAERDVLPILGGLSEIRGQQVLPEQILEAVYYDTADLRLAAAGVTLRRRSGGKDAGWHLKLPRGGSRKKGHRGGSRKKGHSGGSRDELRVPLDRAAQGPSPTTPPAELAALTRGYARGAALQPVAQMTTQRRRWQLTGDADEPVAEVVDDQVVASTVGDHPTAKSWQEVEVELLDGGTPELLDRLERRLGKAGVRRSGAASKLARLLGDRVPARPAAPAPDRKSTAGAAVLAYLKEQAEEIIRWDPLVRQQVPDSVHRMRVAARRMRSALQAFGKLIRPDRAHWLVGELKWLGEVLGPARDLEVLQQRFEGGVAALPAEEVVGPVAQRLTRYFGPREAGAGRDVRAALDDSRYLTLLNEIEVLLRDPPLTRWAHRPARRELPRLIRRVERKVHRRMGRAEAHRPGSVRDTALHEVRKAAKRLRYATEVARPVTGKPARRFTKRAKELAGLLGAHHDAAVSGPLLRELGMQAHLDSENGYSYGLLHAQQRSETRDVERALPELWRRLTARKSRRWLR